MSYWNHRVVKQVLENGEEWFSVREVHYNEDGSIYAYMTDPVEISGNNIDELRAYLQWCLDCLDEPVLEDGKVEFIDPYANKNDLADNLDSL